MYTNIFIHCPQFFQKKKHNYVGMVGPGMHIYIYVGPGAQFEDMTSPRMVKHLPKNLCILNI